MKLNLLKMCIIVLSLFFTDVLGFNTNKELNCIKYNTSLLADMPQTSLLSASGGGADVGLQDKDGVVYLVLS